MPGVEVLAKEEIVNSVFNLNAFFITFVICIIGFVVIGVYLIEASGTELLVWVGFGVMCGAWLGCFIGEITKIPNGYEVHYKVAISDDVSLKDFYEKYDILSVDGEIFTVRMRHCE